MLKRLLHSVLLLLLLGGTVSAAEPAEDDGVRFFREKIEPVLKKECFGCHSAFAKEVKGGLRLDTRVGLRTGGDSGPVVALGKADKSRLVQAIRHEGDLAMPPEKPKLPDQTIADFVKWVEMGAADPRQDTAALERDPRQHWAFQPIHISAPPEVKDKSWPQSPLDTFVLAKLEQRNWFPAPAASRASGSAASLST